jgi:hypothetical protein
LPATTICSRNQQLANAAAADTSNDSAAGTRTVTRRNSGKSSTYSRMIATNQLVPIHGA